jgi:nucleoside-diphosphate-sugar epimerase
MRILLTGNLGYVGTVMTDRLQASGHDIRGFDSGYFADCTLEKAPEPEEQVLADVRDFDSRALDGIDAVVHLAALSNDPLGELDAPLTNVINVGGLERIARAAKDAGINRFVFASSCSLYGLADGSVALDETCPQNPLTAYARSKVDGESVLADLTDRAFRPISLRFATAFGYSPRLRLDLVVNNLVASALGRGVVALESDGTPWRPLVHVQDMAAAVICALQADLEVCGAQAFNVGSESENYQIITIAKAVSEACDNVPVTAKPLGAGGDQRSYNVAFGKIRQLMPQFQTTWNLAAGIDDLVQRLRALNRTGIIDDPAFYRIRKVRSLVEGGTLDYALKKLVMPSMTRTT